MRAGQAGWPSGPRSRAAAAQFDGTRAPTRPLPTALLLALVVAVAVLAAAGCGGTPEGDTGGTAEGRLLVATSTPVLYSLTSNVVGSAARVENLLAPGASPHQTSFTPEQARLIADADVLILNGAGLETWADDLVKSSGNEALDVVVASTGLEFLRPDEPVPVEGGATGDEQPADVDPHVWLDVRNAQQMVSTIAEALAVRDPAGAAGYRERAAAYRGRLESLHDEIEAELAGVPRKEFVAFHSAFQYYARAYGLEQVAVIQQFPGKDPSAKYLAGIVDLIEQLGVRAVFAEPQFSPRPADALAAEAGVKVYTVDPEGSTLSPGMYEELMRANTATFVEALGGDR